MQTSQHLNISTSQLLNPSTPMTPITIFALIIIIISLGFLFDTWLDYINSNHLTDELPEELKGIYKEEEYKRSQQYKKENDRLGLLSGILSFVLILLMLFFDGFAFFDLWIRNFTEHPIWLALIFFAILGFASGLLGLPFQLYSTFVIEEKYGFNKTTVKTFILDRIKSLILSALIGGGLMALIIYLYLQFSSLFWLLAWAAITGFTLFMSFFYSNLIVPLFNKQTPLEEGELRTGIQQFSDKVGFKLKNIFVIDGSKRTSKANAYFTGLGKKKRIVLYDNLINDLKTEEIVAVLAHEVGHYKKKHIIKSMIVSIIHTGILLYIFNLVVNNPVFSQALGVEKASFHIGLIVFSILYSPVSTLLGIGMNIWSRKNEYEADRYAKHNFNAAYLIEALKKISVKALSNLKPHPLYVFVKYSHPTLLQRIRALLQ